MIFERMLFEMVCGEIDRLYRECMAVMLLQEQVYFHQEMTILDTIQLLETIKMLKK